MKLPSDPGEPQSLLQKACPLHRCSHAVPDSPYISSSQSQCWCSMAHKLHRRQTLQNNNDYLLGNVLLIPLHCVACNRKDGNYLSFTVRISVGHSVVTFHPFPEYSHLSNKIASKVTIPSSLPRLNWPRRKITTISLKFLFSCLFLL
jgi:hypothetical protein